MAGGVCILHLPGFLLQDPWEEIQHTFKVPCPTGRRPLRATGAKDAVKCMAGVPTNSLERMVRDWDLHADAVECVQIARSAGITPVLALDAPQGVVEALGHRLGTHSVAALTPEVVMGRLTGDLITPSWVGPCGDALCLGEVARAAREDLGGPVWVVSKSRGCPCIRGQTIGPAEFKEQVAMKA